MRLRAFVGYILEAIIARNLQPLELIGPSQSLNQRAALGIKGNLRLAALQPLQLRIQGARS